MTSAVPPEAITIRPFSLTDPDLAQIIEIENASFAAEAYQIEDFQWAYRKCSELSMVAEIAGRIVGYVMTCPLRTRAHVYSLAVAPAYRGMGIGKALFSYTEYRLSERGIGKIELEVKKTNRAGRSFWRQMGFIDVGMIPDFYDDGAEAILMRKSIGAS